MAEILKRLVTATDLMVKEVKTVPKSMRVKDLIQRLALQHVSGFPVVDETGQLAGVISETDIVKAQAHLEGADLSCSSFYEYDPFGGQLAYFEECTPRLLEQRAQDLMTHEVITARPQESLHLVVQRLLEHRLHRLIVVEEKKILGLISTLDIVNTFASGKIAQGFPATVQGFMSDTPVAHEDLFIRELLDLLAENEMSGVPVIREEGIASGVISQTDIIRKEAETDRQRYKSPDYYRLDPLLKKVPLVRDFAQEILEKRVKEFMTSPIISVLPGTSLVAAAQTMVAKRVHRLLVVDPEGRLKGILGTLDILQALIPALNS
jgi:CBS domain-containing protein